MYRPSHADYTYQATTASATGRAAAAPAPARRLRVAAGAIACKLLREAAGVRCGWLRAPDPHPDRRGAAGNGDPGAGRSQHRALPRRAATAEAMVARIDQARREGDSLGVWWSAWRMACPRVGASRSSISWRPTWRGRCSFHPRGARLRDRRRLRQRGPHRFATQRRLRQRVAGAFAPAPTAPGGVQGGISNGEPIAIRVAFKPTATISREQDTVDEAGRPAKLAARGRHDPACCRVRHRWSRR